MLSLLPGFPSSAASLHTFNPLLTLKSKFPLSHFAVFRRNYFYPTCTFSHKSYFQFLVLEGYLSSFFIHSDETKAFVTLPLCNTDTHGGVCVCVCVKLSTKLHSVHINSQTKTFRSDRRLTLLHSLCLRLISRFLYNRTVTLAFFINLI